MAAYNFLISNANCQESKEESLQNLTFFAQEITYSNNCTDGALNFIVVQLEGGELHADILFLKHDSSILRQSSNHVCGSWKSLNSLGRANPVLHGPISTEPNLFHHGETTYRVG